LEKGHGNSRILENVHVRERLTEERTNMGWLYGKYLGGREKGLKFPGTSIRDKHNSSCVLVIETAVCTLMWQLKSRSHFPTSISRNLNCRLSTKEINMSALFFFSRSKINEI